MRAIIDGALDNQFARYLINGLVATAVHFGVLTLNLHVLGMHSAGVANGVAAVFGIAVSFVGSRYFVFRSAERRLFRQGLLFVLIYACIAGLHGLVMYVWSDRLGWDYRGGFIAATFMQVAFSYVANKFLVFK